MQKTDLSLKNLIIFDLDGTIALSKSALDSEMVSSLAELLAKKSVAVISGGGFPEFEKQFLGVLISEYPEIDFSSLFIFPTCSTSFYKYSEKSGRRFTRILCFLKKKKRFFLRFNKFFKRQGMSNLKKCMEKY